MVSVLKSNILSLTRGKTHIIIIVKLLYVYIRAKKDVIHNFHTLGFYCYVAHLKFSKQLVH